MTQPVLLPVDVRLLEEQPVKSLLRRTRDNLPMRDAE